MSLSTQIGSAAARGARVGRPQVKRLLDRAPHRIRSGDTPQRRRGNGLGCVPPSAAFSTSEWMAAVILIVVIGGRGSLEGPIIGLVVVLAPRAVLTLAIHASARAA